MHFSWSYSAPKVKSAIFQMDFPQIGKGLQIFGVQHFLAKRVPFKVLSADPLAFATPVMLELFECEQFTDTVYCTFNFKKIGILQFLRKKLEKIIEFNLYSCLKH